MKIKADTAVTIDYTLKGDEGEVIDTSEGGLPLHYLHGHGNIVPGLEEALEGKAVGERFEISIPPEKGYGSREPKLVFDVPLSDLPQDVKPQKGIRLQLESDEGEVIDVTVVKVKIRAVEVDGNHPLADKTLHFAVTVRAIRAASSTELEHGHVHTPGHHHH